MAALAQESLTPRESSPVARAALAPATLAAPAVSRDSLRAEMAAQSLVASPDKAASAQASKATAPSYKQETKSQQQILDTDIKSLEEQQAATKKKVVDVAHMLTGGAKSNLDSTNKSLAETGIIDRLSGYTSALEKQQEVDSRHFQSVSEHERKVTERYENSLAASKAAKEMIENANKLDKLGYKDQAELMRKNASDTIANARKALEGLSSIDKDELRKTMAGLKEVNEKLDTAISRVETAAAVTGVVKEVNHTVGVGVGYVLGGPPGAALVNQGLRMIEAGSEESMNVALGMKTKEQAASDFASRSADAVIESGITLVAGAAGNKLGKIVNAAKGPALAKVVDVAGTGLVQAGGEAVKVGYDYVQAKIKFDQKYGNLKGAEREKALQQFMAENHLDLAGVSKRLGVSFASGAGSKLVGKLLSGQATAGLRHHVANNVGDITGKVIETTGSGGELSAGSMLSSVVGSMITHKAVASSQPKPVSSQSAKPSSEVDVPPVVEHAVDEAKPKNLKEREVKLSNKTLPSAHTSEHIQPASNKVELAALGATMRDHVENMKGERMSAQNYFATSTNLSPALGGFWKQPNLTGTVEVVPARYAPNGNRIAPEMVIFSDKADFDAILRSRKGAGLSAPSGGVAMEKHNLALIDGSNRNTDAGRREFLETCIEEGIHCHGHEEFGAKLGVALAFNQNARSSDTMLHVAENFSKSDLKSSIEEAKRMGIEIDYKALMEAFRRTDENNSNFNHLRRM